jgi:SAM-dependent methyltransferase
MELNDKAALATYEQFAAIYDEFNHANNYEMWLGEKLLPELQKRGLRKGQVLDVGCGTGRAFPPLLSRGWEILGCDLSPAMLARARQRSGDWVQLAVADMRALPVLGSFELVLAMNDAVNYLIGDGDLERALRGMCANLSADGLLLFDTNSRLMFRIAYESMEYEVEKDGQRWTWTGLGRPDESRPIYRVRIDGDGIEPFVNDERYFAIGDVEAAISASGLELLAVLGQREDDDGLVLRDPPDDGRDHKIVYIARARQRSAPQS